MSFGVKSYELRSEEVSGDDGGEDEAGVELLALTEQEAVRTVLDEATIGATVEAINSLNGPLKEAIGGGGWCLNSLWVCESHSFGFEHKKKEKDLNKNL